MPTSIDAKDISRMFPYEFYDELNQAISGFALINPAFLSDKVAPLTPDARKTLYGQTRKATGIYEQLTGTNILDVEPFGELLMLEAVCRDEDLHTFVYEPEKRSQIPMSTLAVQLYDSSRQPVFSVNVADESIRFIPEVLYDDPNLLIAAVTFTETGIQVAIFKAPPDIEARYLEVVDAANSPQPETPN